jgi:hypothetical protein
MAVSRNLLSASATTGPDELEPLPYPLTKDYSILPTWSSERSKPIRLLNQFTKSADPARFCFGCDSTAVTVGSPRSSTRTRRGTQAEVRLITADADCRICLGEQD